VASLVQACSGAGGESSSNGTDPSLMLMPNCRTRRGPRRGKAPEGGLTRRLKPPSQPSPLQANQAQTRLALPGQAKPRHQVAGSRHSLRRVQRRRRSGSDHAKHPAHAHGTARLVGSSATCLECLYKPAGKTQVRLDLTIWSPCLSARRSRSWRWPVMLRLSPDRSSSDDLRR
jgi:hypothetical protein